MTTNEPEHRCSTCNSDRVERLFLVWVDANDYSHVDDYGPLDDGSPGRFFCRECNEKGRDPHPESLDGNGEAIPGIVCPLCGGGLASHGCNQTGCLSCGACQWCGHHIDAEQRGHEVNG